ncbi:MAG: T9SS type A sorting domain-containing protein [Flavobacteriales bacterium]|nr:T9SS type A sorting domain-containing protein [Flavobacteriales bacterium]
MSFYAFGSNAQVVINGAGITITVSTGTQLVVEGGAQLNAAAVFENDGAVHVLGDWTNNSGGNGFNATSTGSVYLHNPLPQVIQGTAITDFRNLVISGGTKTLLGNAQCGTAAQADGSLTLNSGVLLLNTRSFSLYNPASAALVAVGGSIRSESTDLLSRFQWALGNDITEHRVPFSDGSGNALPFGFTPSAAYPANTLLSIATYHTAADNTVYPITVNQQVLHMAGVAAADNSANTVDRFWLVDLPYGSLTGALHLSYSSLDDASLGAGSVRAQRWLESGGTWQAPLSGQTQPFLREVVVPNVVFSDVTAPANEHIWAMAYDLTPLPVTLLSFEARCEGTGVSFAWRTASEQNSALFTVERSVDGLSWSMIGSSSAMGTSHTPTAYGLVDPTIIADIPLLYRLVEHSTDGTTTALATISAPACSPPELVLFPNPASDRVFAQLPVQSAKTLVVTVHDATGRAVHQQNVEPSAMPVMLNITGFAAGTYHVRFATTDGNWYGTGRFVKH